MRKLISVITLAFVLALLVPAAAEASAARNASPGCVTKKEWNKLRRNMTVAKVSRVFGTKGKQIYYLDRGRYEGEYVEEIDYDNTYYYGGEEGEPYHYDEYGNEVPGYATYLVYDESTGGYVEEIDYDNTYYYSGGEGEPYHYDEFGDEVPGYATYEYFDETGGDYISKVDVVRSYKKCRSFDRGRGRVGINFDDYTGSDTKLRAYARKRNVNDFFYRQAGRVTIIK